MRVIHARYCCSMAALTAAAPPLAFLAAALGGFSFWGPRAARALFAVDAEAADLLFGAITVRRLACCCPRILPGHLWLPPS